MSTPYSKSWNGLEMLNFNISPYNNCICGLEAKSIYIFTCTEDENPSLLVVSTVVKTTTFCMVDHPPGQKEKVNTL